MILGVFVMQIEMLPKIQLHHRCLVNIVNILINNWSDFSWKLPQAEQKSSPKHTNILGVRGAQYKRIPARGGGTQREPNRFIFCLIFNTALLCRDCCKVVHMLGSVTAHTHNTSACVNLLHGSAEHISVNVREAPPKNLHPVFGHCPDRGWGV